MAKTFTIEELYVNYDQMWEIKSAGEYNTEEEIKEANALAQKTANEHFNRVRLKIWENKREIEEIEFYEEEEV